MSGILSGLKIIGTPGSGGGGGGNATVPLDAFIQPPQAYVDYAPFASASLYNIAVSTSQTFSISNLGVTHFSLADGQSYSGVTEPYIGSSNTLDITMNLLPTEDVIQFFSDVLLGLQNSGGNSLIISAHGPNMGCPLTGGTVGGWEIDLTAYTVGVYESIALAGAYIGHGSSQGITLDSLLNFDDSLISPPTLEGWIAHVVGVMDLPTKTQILEKLSELFLLANPGTTEIVGDVLTYTDAIAREWAASTPATFTATASGTNPTNADIDALIGAFCTGSFTGPDGATQINF